MTELVKLQPIASKARRDYQNQKQPGYSHLILTIPGLLSEIARVFNEALYRAPHWQIWSALILLRIWNLNPTFPNAWNVPWIPMSSAGMMCSTGSTGSTSISEPSQSSSLSASAVSFCTVMHPAFWRDIFLVETDFRKKSVGSDWGKICWNSISNRYLDAQVQTWRSRISANADVKCTKNCVFSVFVLMSVMTSWINSVSWYAIYSCMTDWCNVFVLSEMVFIRLKKTLINTDTGQY